MEYGGKLTFSLAQLNRFKFWLKKAKTARKKSRLFTWNTENNSSRLNFIDSSYAYNVEYRHFLMSSNFDHDCVV